MEINEQVTEQVNKIIQTNLDRREGYEKAMDQVKDESLKSLFADCSRQSNENINELRQIVIQHGGDPVTTTTAAGDLYRVWMDVKAALAASNTKAVLQSCEKGEDIALNAYRDVAKATDGNALPELVATAIHRQQDGILAMHNKVKALRDAQ